MTELLLANILDTLGLSWQKLLLFLANFLILFLGLTFLLFKPVKKFMAKRQKEIEEGVNAAKNAQKVTENAEKDYEARMTEANEQAGKKLAEAETSADEIKAKAKEVLVAADKRAEEIVAEAKKEAENEKKTIIASAKGEVIDMAIELAGNILERNITAEDNAAIIEETLNEWEKHD